MKPTITVGIPFHKSADPLQLNKSIESIINQTRKPDVIQLIQDGEVSSEIEEVVDQFRDNVIDRITFQENHGLAYVLNYSINKSGTKYYARMDADDIARTDRISKQIQFLEDNPDIDILGSYAIDIDFYGNEMSLRKMPTDHESIVKFIWSCPIIHPTVVFRRKSIMRTELYDESLKRRQDYELWFRCVKSGLKFANLPEPLLKYRHTEDWFKKNNKKVIWEQVKMGWKGCRMIGASPAAYIGTSFPLVKAILPNKMVMKMEKLIKNIDPRHQKS